MSSNSLGCAFLLPVAADVEGGGGEEEDSLWDCACFFTFLEGSGTGKGLYVMAGRAGAGVVDDGDAAVALAEEPAADGASAVVAVVAFMVFLEMTGKGLKLFCGARATGCDGEGGGDGNGGDAAPPCCFLLAFLDTTGKGLKVGLAGAGQDCVDSGDDVGCCTTTGGGGGGGDGAGNGDVGREVVSRPCVAIVVGKVEVVVRPFDRDPGLPPPPPRVLRKDACNFFEMTGKGLNERDVGVGLAFASASSTGGGA